MPPPSSPEPAAPAVFVEALELRIAPAALIDPGQVVGATIGTPQLLKAGQTLSTSTTGGAYLLHVEAGAVLVFTTDLNGNKTPDFNEITGLSVSDGAQLTIFTDVHGDTATNLRPVNNGATYELTDSDNDRTNGLDGRVLLPSHIDRITLRSLQAGDLDTTVPGETVLNRLALSGYSIFGTIYSGGDFGSTGNGLLINTAGATLQAQKFAGNTGLEYFPGAAATALNPVIGGIKTGTAASFQPFNFGSSFGPVNGDVSGSFTQFTPAPGAHGGDIIGVHSTNNANFSIGTLATGDGGTSLGASGTGARGGNLSEIVLKGDAGGYHLLAGNGGQGFSGGVGGSVIAFSDQGSVTSEAIIHSGDGGQGSLALGGAAGTVTFATVSTDANLRVLLGNGGDGTTTGGDGAGQATAVITGPESQTPLGVKVLATTRDPFTFLNAGTGQYTTHPQVGDTLVFVTDPGTGQQIPLHAYDVGTSRSFDFDNDGFADAIFTSSNPDQVVLVFGKDPLAANAGSFIPSQAGQLRLGSSYDPTRTIFLNSPVNPEAVVVGDFNADGRPDVAVASGSAANFGGISVFLNQIGDNLRNPTTVPSYTGNPLGNHPFSDGLQTTIPTLGPENANPAGGYLKSPVAIRNLAVGDFNGDGVLDLAYLGVYQHRDVDVVTPYNQVTVLFGDTDAENPYGNGHFYANPALPTDAIPVKVQTGLTTNLTSAALPILQATAAANTGAPPTATRTTDTSSPALPSSVSLGQHDSLFAGTPGVGEQSKFIREYAVNFNPGNLPNTNGTGPHQPFQGGLGSDILSAGISASPATTSGAIFLPTRISLGQVDTNRGADTTLTDVVLLDFNLQDYNRDGRADLVVLSDQPVQFLTALIGSGNTGNGNPGNAGQLPSTTFTLTVTSDINVGANNSGFKINDTGNDRALRAADDPNTFQPNLLARFTLPTVANSSSSVQLSRFAPVAGPPAANANPNFLDLVSVGSIGIPTLGNDRTVVSFDQVRSRTDPTVAANNGFEALFPSQGVALQGRVGFGFADPLTNPVRFNLTANGVQIAAGDGGNALTGAGGKGGTVGATLTAAGAAGPVGSVNITLPAYVDYLGRVSLNGGNGGAGFGNGGVGGDVMGDTVRYTPTATTLNSAVIVQAGDGGAGIAGVGGRGGDIAQTVLSTARVYGAGDGGSGSTGGRGGNVTGNTFNVPDTSTFDVIVTAGNGGLGSLNGGDGGGVLNFRPQFLPIIGSVGGPLTYVGGNGGNGGGGFGGRGGDVLNSSPDTSVNFLAGSITITAGGGGNGLLGGRGGGVNNFVNSPTTQSAVPTSVTVLGGDGGVGINQRGGLGGTVQSINVTASGLVDTQTLNLNVLNRAIAGAGGASFGQDGGTGGAILAVNLTSISQPVAAASGAGGAGLLSGGSGGAVTNVVLNAAGTPGRFGKVLAVAGAGGDAAAIAAGDVNSPGDPVIPGQPASLVRNFLSLGGLSGVGGDGGSITGLTQQLGTQVNVDLIAGNGGSIRYGNSFTPTGNVGRGGSVTGINVTGEIGTSLGETVSAVSPPIASYSVFTAATPTGVRPATVADLVATALRDTNTRVFSYVDPDTLNNLLANPTAPNIVVGNVGIVAGIAGRVGAVNGVAQPSIGTPNGAVVNVSARNIMSVVAGSVDSVAPVDNIANLRATGGDRILGADKSPMNPGLPNSNPLGTANNVVEYLDLTGRVVSDLQPGDRLLDGAIYTFANTTGDLQSGPRVFIFPQG